MRKMRCICRLTGMILPLSTSAAAPRQEQCPISGIAIRRVGHRKRAHRCRNARCPERPVFGSSKSSVNVRNEGHSGLIPYPDWVGMSEGTYFRSAVRQGPLSSRSKGTACTLKAQHGRRACPAILSAPPPYSDRDSRAVTCQAPYTSPGVSSAIMRQSGCGLHRVSM